MTKIENYSIFHRFYRKKESHDNVIIYMGVATRLYRGWKYFQFCKKARKSAATSIECPFLFSLPAKCTKPNRINGSQHKSLQFCFQSECSGDLTFVYDIYIMYEYNPKWYRVARQTKFRPRGMQNTRNIFLSLSEKGG